MNKYEIKNWAIENKKLVVKIIFGLLLLVVAASFYFNQKGQDEDYVVLNNTGETQQNQEGVSITSEPAIMEIAEEKWMIIDVSGAVVSPGIVKIPEGGRVYEAVEDAGGLKNNADTQDVNLAAILTDGDKIYIPAANEQKSNVANRAAGIVTNQISGGSEKGTSSSNSAGLININTATSEQLQTLNGIGPSTAEKIITYRESIGGFKKIENLMDVSGIGQKTFEKFKDKIMV